MSKAIHTAAIICFLTITSFGQKAEQALNSFREKFPVEKAYIHLDKDIYSKGETVWFKAYLYHDNKPSGLSTNFFLLLLNNKGKTIITKQYPVIGATVKGSIVLPDSLQAGNYYIKAFTPGMLNYDEPIVCTKSLFLGGASQTPSSATRDISLQFFPESGNLVDGIEMITGFKAVDQYGTPVEIKGVIKTDDDATVTSFSSYHDGIGRVVFTPKAGKKYTAEVQTDVGPRYYPLPEVKLSGINLDVQDEKGAKKILLSRSEKDKSKFDILLLVAEINNQVVFENEIAFEDYPSVTGKIGTESLPSGILHFTVFTKEGLPLAERLSFVDNNEYRSEAVARVIKSGFTKKQENIIDIFFPDSAVRSCSVSVIDLASADDDNRESIYSGLLLSSDLRGYIHNPGWYFENRDKNTAVALDNLMLTHGWSRFNWKKILAGDLPAKKYTDDHYMSISGTVFSGVSKKPVEGGRLKILIEAQDSSVLQYELSVNENGRFSKDSLIFMGESKVYYEYSNSKGTEKQIQIIADSAAFSFTHPANILFIPQKYPAIYTGSLKEWPGIKAAKQGDPTAKVLESVVVKSTIKRPDEIVNEKYTSQLFRTGGKIMINNIDEPPVDKGMNGFDYVMNRLDTKIGLQYGHLVNWKNFSLEDHTTPDNIKRPASNPVKRFWEVALFINETPTDIVHLRSLRADQIAMVKFFEAGFIGAGQNYPGGAVAIYLNYESVIPKQSERPEQFMKYNGYSVTKEFYNPQYAVSATQKDVPDNRTTLYWNPEVYLDDQTNSIRVNFYNNDFSKRFRIIVEGFDARGKLIHFGKIIGE